MSGVVYVGVAVIDGNGIDKSGLGGALLEDGKSHQNGLNGFGSGLAYAGNGNFYALADRGPNKVVYSGGAAVDNTTSYDNRFQQFHINLTPVGSPDINGKYSSYQVNTQNTGTVLLKNSSDQQYQGISSGSPVGTGNPRLDSEGIVVAPDHSVWISDEYGPYILHFDAQGHQIGSLTLPQGFQIANPGATGAFETANNTFGRVNNRGMEGLAITPDGKHLVGMMQSSLIQDGGLTGVNTRIIVYDLTDPLAAPKQFDYRLDNTSNVVSDILAINDHQFLVGERNSASGAQGVKLLYEIDLNQANAPTDLAGTVYSGTNASNGMPATAIPNGVTPLDKHLFANIGDLLRQANPFSSVNGKGDLPDKIEGYAWGPDLADGRHLLLATNDNDYAQSQISGYPNYFFAFAVDPSDVPGFQPAVFVPEPGSLTIGVVGCLSLLVLGFRAQRRSSAS
ncbi:MAG: esterase-like activity of phytase family protein [Planctomycetes bacterium]|nr:esterase-like activity of phytase family protein [Planctomycetota bacterium]